MSMAKKANTDSVLTKAIEALDMGRGKDFSTLFDDFLDFMLSFSCGNPSEHQQELFDNAKREPELWNAYVKAIEAYDEAANDYNDPLGDTFMERISHGQNGQFFTPDSLCELLSKIANGEDAKSLYDPACGSGRTLLAGLRASRMMHKNPEVVGGDISRLCAKMTLANLLHNNAHGEVAQGDSLKLDIEKFLFYRLETVMCIASGSIFTHYWQYTTHSVGEVQQKRESWYREAGKRGIYLFNPARMMPDGRVPAICTHFA